MKEINSRMEWRNVYTSKQKGELVKAVIMELELLLSSQSIKDINEDIFLPLGEKNKDGYRLVLQNSGVHFEKDRTILGQDIKTIPGKDTKNKENWPEMIEEFKLSPTSIEKLRLLIETPLSEQLKEEM